MCSAAVSLGWQLLSQLCCQRVALFSIRLNILVLGGSSGFIELYAYGMFKIARVTGVSSSKFSVSLRKQQLIYLQNKERAG